MTQIGTSTPTPQIKPRNDVYTILVIIATLFVLMGTAFLVVRSNQLFGQWLPMGTEM